MRTVTIELTGTMPMLQHASNIDWSDKMEEWQKDPDNKRMSKAGDDRTPPWRWIGYLNCDDPKKGVITVPTEYLMRSIMGGAAQVPTGKRQETFKTLSQSGIVPAESHMALLVNGKPIQMSEVQKLFKLKTFKEHVDATQDLGFSLFVKPVKIGTGQKAPRHIRVRPRFDNWSLRGELVILEDQITDTILTRILDISGRLKGLGDWRPGAPTPGQFGKFEGKVLS